MRKFLERIFGIISILILGYQQFCYADVIVSDPVDDIKPVVFLVGFIEIIILIISAISFFSLKATIKKQNMPGFDSEKLKVFSADEIEKKNSRIQRRLYMWGMILAISVLIYLGISEEISAITFFIPIITFVISVIVRLNKKKKVSNIICAISVACVCLIAAWVGINNKMAENYNNQFLKYEKIGVGAIRHEPRYISDIEGFINTAIKSNRSLRKITIIYQDTNYKSPEELKQLLSKLNTNQNYLVVKKYDKNYDYIESITLSSYVSSYFSRLQQYEGNKQRGSVVKALIQQAMSLVSNDSYYGENLKISIIYTSETGQKTNVNLNTDSSETITSLRNEIKAAKTYNVELQTDSNDMCNIIITSNN